MGKKLLIKSEDSNKTYIQNFQVITDCPFLTEKHIERALILDSIGYRFIVSEKKIL